MGRNEIITKRSLINIAGYTDFGLGRYHVAPHTEMISPPPPIPFTGSLQ